MEDSMRTITVAIDSETHTLARHATAVTKEDLRAFVSRIVSDESIRVLKAAGITIPQPKKPTKR